MSSSTFLRNLVLIGIIPFAIGCQRSKFSAKKKEAIPTQQTNQTRVNPGTTTTPPSNQCPGPNCPILPPPGPECPGSPDCLEPLPPIVDAPLCPGHPSCGGDIRPLPEPPIIRDPLPPRRPTVVVAPEPVVPLCYSHTHTVTEF